MKVLTNVSTDFCCLFLIDKINANSSQSYMGIDVSNFAFLSAVNFIPY